MKGDTLNQANAASAVSEQIKNESPTPDSTGLGNVPPLKNKGSLQHYERIIELNLSKVKESCIALLEIHRNKLYKSGYKSFDDYLMGRWGIKRSRGYQLLAFARRLKMSTMVDTPANERQSRGSTASKIKNFNWHWDHTRAYILTRFGTSSLQDKTEFVIRFKKLVQMLDDTVCQLNQRELQNGLSATSSGQPQ